MTNIINMDIIASFIDAIVEAEDIGDFVESMSIALKKGGTVLFNEDLIDNINEE